MDTLLELEQQGKKTCIVKEGRKKVHTAFPKDAERVEEYSLQSDELLVRKWRRPTVLGADTDWEFEVGEPDLRGRAAVHTSDSFMVESSTQPQFVMQDETNYFVFRIRNVPWSADTYQLSLEEDKIVLRTTNRKYFKRFEIPMMKTAGLLLDARSLTCQHANSTLLIKYKKPDEILKFEASMREERRKMKVQDNCENQ